MYENNFSNKKLDHWSKQTKVHTTDLILYTKLRCLENMYQNLHEIDMGMHLVSHQNMFKQTTRMKVLYFTP